MSSSSKSTHDYSRKLQRAILEPWRQSHNLPPSPPPNRNTPTSPSTTNSSPSLSPPQNPSPNQITHELHHLSNLLEINLQQVIDATNPSPPTSPCIPPPSLDQLGSIYGFRQISRRAIYAKCPSYQAELKKRKSASIASTSGIFSIELYAFSNKTCVYDTCCGTHIYNTSQGLRESRKLKHRALSPYVGNGMRATIEDIGSFDLILPSGLIIVLDKCHFAPSITRLVVSIPV
ncbi:hypothetical protein Tco_0011803 [Tanacetum coccineum]